MYKIQYIYLKSRRKQQTEKFGHFVQPYRSLKDEEDFEWKYKTIRENNFKKQEHYRKNNGEFIRNNKNE